LTQAQLAARASTSQAAISAYESGAKQPAIDTLSRLLATMGARLTVTHGAEPIREPTRAELQEAGHRLVEVLELAPASPGE
jgi:transcriptional regulator with XRE-family HTH domain